MENELPPTDRTLDRRFLAVLLSVALAALAARLTYIAAGPPSETPDSYQYRTIEENIRAHHSFSLDLHAPFGPTIHRAPLYPLFLVLSGDRALIGQSVLDSLVAALICVILHGLVRLRWIAAAGMTYALHPAAIYYASSILSETLFTFLLIVAVAVLLIGIRRDRRSWIFAAGLLMGLATLARPIAAPLLVVVAAVIWFSRKSVRRPFTTTVVFSVATLVAMAPWIVRSSLVAGHFVLVIARGPMNFALATAPEQWTLNDQSSIWQNEHYWREDPCGRALMEAHTPPESARADDICMQTALANLKTNPRDYIRNRIGQLAHFPLSSFDVATGNSISFQSALRQRAWTVFGVKAGLFTLFSLVPLLAGLIGLFVGRLSLEKALCGAMWVFTILIYLPGYVEYRYFVPAVPMLLITAAFALDWLERAIRRRRAPHCRSSRC